MGRRTQVVKTLIIANTVKVPYLVNRGRRIKNERINNTLVSVKQPNVFIKKIIRK